LTGPSSKKPREFIPAEFFQNTWMAGLARMIFLTFVERQTGHVTGDSSSILRVTSNISPQSVSSQR
jgi:hypothetical protein